MEEISNEEGAKMIVYLQNYAGIKESMENALKGWKSLSTQEKATTKKYYDLFNSEEN